MPTDPTGDIVLPTYKTDGFPTWAAGDIRKFQATHVVGQPERMAMELMLLTGLRRSDVAVIGWQHIQGRVLSIDTAKTGSRISIELSDRLLDMIDTMKRKSLHLIENSHGKPFTKESLGNGFKEKCTDAGVSKSARGLRKLSGAAGEQGS